jgi:hypothetical protein
MQVRGEPTLVERSTPLQVELPSSWRCGGQGLPDSVPKRHAGRHALYGYVTAFLPATAIVLA